MAAKLTQKKESFCNEYIIDFNGTQSAIRAGYSVKTANEQASRLLANVNIQERIAELIKERSERTEITQDRVLIEIARIAFNDPRKAFDEKGDLLNIQDWPDEVAAAISSIKITDTKIGDDSNIQLKEVKFWSKDKQIELAAKHLGMFIEKKEISGPNGGAIGILIEEINGNVLRPTDQH